MQSNGKIDLDGLVKKKGIMYVWTKKNIASRELEIKIRDQLGVEQQLVGPKEINDLEPNLKKFYHGGVFYPNARHTINPRKVLLKLFDLFLKKGGKFKKINVENIIFSTFVFLNLPPFFKNRSNNFNNTFLGFIVCLALG